MLSKKDITIRKMEGKDIEKLLNNFVEQGWKRARKLLEDYFYQKNLDDIQLL